MFHKFESVLYWSLKLLMQYFPPVITSYYLSFSFAFWKNCRLKTENRKAEYFLWYTIIPIIDSERMIKNACITKKTSRWKVSIQFFIDICSDYDVTAHSAQNERSREREKEKFWNLKPETRIWLMYLAG